MSAHDVGKTRVSPAETLEQRAASTAGGGTALTTTLALISIPLNSKYLSLTPRNFVTAVVAQYILNPFLTIITTTDALGGTSNHGFTDTNEPTSLSEFATQNISDEMQDGDSEDFDINFFDTAANNNYIYVGAKLPFRGVAVDLNNKNDTASVLTVNYWNGGAWADTSASDGTDVGPGDTFKQDGNVTWTVPTGWKKDSLVNIGDTTVSEYSDALYWTRWEFSVQLDTTVDLVQMRPLNRSTAYAELVEEQEREMSLFGSNQFSCVEALVNAGTGNLVVNVDAIAERFR